MERPSTFIVGGAVTSPPNCVRVRFHKGTVFDCFFPLHL